MSGSNEPDLSPPMRAAMSNLVKDVAAAEVVRAFADVGIPSVILKGAALSDWYPADAIRSYLDADVWIPLQAQADAAAILVGLGFEHESEQLDAAALPDWYADHATTWLRSSDGGKIDLHRRLQGVGRPPDDVWSLLWPRTEMFKMAGQQVRRLPTDARALYVTLHAAGHGSGYAGSQLHLHAALDVVGRAAWESAAELACELDAVDMFSTGLRLVPAGVVLADELGLPAISSVEAALYTITPPPVAFGFERLAGAAGTVPRLKLVLQKLFPAPGFVRHWWPPAARNRLMLAVGYSYRPLWILLRAPAGWRAWRKARRQVRDQERAVSSSR